MIRPNTVLLEEKLVEKALLARGIMMSRPGEGEPTNPLSQQWGVFHGSHGGYGRRLRTAMERSLKCCGLGATWTMPDGDGLIRTFFQQVAEEHLGGPLKLPTWKRAPKP